MGTLAWGHAVKNEKCTSICSLDKWTDMKNTFHDCIRIILLAAEHVVYIPLCSDLL